MHIRSSTRAVTLVAVLAMLAGACAGSDESAEPTPTDTGSPTGGAAASPTDGGDDEPQRAEVQELIAAYPDDQFATSESNAKRFPNYPLNANVCEPLVRLTEEFGVEGVLATDWEFVGDNTFKFTLSEDPVFHNGDPLTPADVAYTLNYEAQEPETSGLSFFGTDSAQVVEGENAVTVTPQEPNLRLVEQINHPTHAIFKEGVDPLAGVQAAGGRMTPDSENAPICTGPFRFSEYVENEHVIVEKNADYWGDEPAQLDKITFRFIPDEATRVLALQSGDVDLISDVERTLVPELEAAEGIKVVRAPAGQTHMFHIARRTADGELLVTDNDEVRLAISHAMDRDAYVNGVLGGEATLINSVTPTEVFAEHAGLIGEIAYDQDAARAALEDAGWVAGDDGVYERDGERLEIRIVFNPSRMTVEQATWVQGQLEEVGFDAEVLQLEQAAYRETINLGNYELDMNVPNQNNANPAFLMALRWYSKARGANAPIITPGPDTEFEALIDQTQQTTDPDELRMLAAQAMNELMTVEIGAVALAGTYRVYAMKEGVQGFDPHPSGINQRYDTVFLTE